MAQHQQRHWWPLAVVCAAVLPLTQACTQDAETPMAATTTNETAPPSSRTDDAAASTQDDASSPTGASVTIEADIDGRTIAGSCSGPSDSARPTVVLVTGLGNPRTQLQQIRTALRDDTYVCAYDRAGLGESSPAPASQTLTEAADDLGAFLDAVGSNEPHVLVGQSVGGSIVQLFALDHPDQVAGLVAMNPVPPYSFTDDAPFKDAAEQQGEKDFFGGANDEGLDMHDSGRPLTEDFPDDLPFVVMFSPDDCPEHLCQAVADAAQSLAEAGASGKFVPVAGAGHEIWQTRPDLVLREIEALLQD